MRTLPLLALALAACLAASVDSTRRRSGGNSEQRGDQQQASKPFQEKNTEYTFTYNAQIASGLIAQSAEDAADPQQQAVTRIQCQAKIQFASERHGQLRLQQCRVGQQNEQMSEPEKVQSMSAFEQKSIPQEQKEQLQQAVQFSFAEGVIERVQFQDDDEAWSKNIKRAVLNMIQMNLKCNNAQGLRSGAEAEQCGDDEELNSQQSSQKRSQQTKLGQTFTIPEITLEGACQTTYTINKVSGTPHYNVTKAINFKKCQKIADVAYGFQTQQPQPQCAQCQQYWAQQQGSSQQQGGEQTQAGTNSRQQQQQLNSAQHPCAQCDPKEVKEQELDRSTVIRCQIHGEPQQKYALERCELLSQYVYRNAKSENGKYGSAMQTVVAATLQARSAQSIDNAQQIPSMSSQKDDTLMYSNEWDVDVKRFYMFGDEQFNGKDKASPFHQVPNVQQAEQALRKLVQSIEDKQKGIEAQATKQLQRLVEMLRMSTQEDLKRIEQQAVNGGGSSSSQQSAHQKRHAKQLYTDALAMCGTHCCVAQLVEKIKKQEISQPKAVQALVAQLPAPSDAIVNQIKELCSSDVVHRQHAVKQSCWLTFGALVNELCQYKTEKNAQQAEGPNAKQSGFYRQDQCPMDKKQQYKEAMLSVYKNSECIYDKMIALMALGNAGLDIMVGDLEEIIKNPAEARVVRVKAIDALRRLRTQMPRKIQRITLPLIQNTREQPQVRTAAFAICMYTLPEPQVVDQLMYTIAKEPNKQVRAFAYKTMKMMAKSRKPTGRQIAKHIKSALKLANVDEQQLHASGKWQLPLYSDEHQEGFFVTLAATISQSSALPVYAHAQLDKQFNDQFQINSVKLYMMQQEAERWYQQISQQYSQQQIKSRAQRQQDRHSSSLRRIFDSLGIKSRRSQQQQQGNPEFGQNSQQNAQPFAMFAIRTNDVDQGFMALDQHIMSEQTRQLLQGEKKLSVASLLGLGQQQQQQQQKLVGTIASSLGEKQAKIPTSAGVPLHVLNSVPVLATIEGQAKTDSESARLESPLGVQLTINVQASASLAHIQKMEVWTPFAASGVQSTRQVQINAPLNAELNASPSQGISVKVKLPQQNKIRLASAHTLPITYTATVDAKTGLIREPKNIRTIHNTKLERQQHEVNTIKGQKQLGMPLHIQGHYHWPAQQTNYQQFLQLLMATENSVQVTYQPGQDSPREAIFHAKCNHFQKSAQREQPDSQLQDFFKADFASPYECEPEQCAEGECDKCDDFAAQRRLDAQEMEDSQEREQQLQQFIGSYKQSQQQQYKHSLKLSAQTAGGARVAKAQAEIQAQCDSKLQFCKVKVDAERTPFEGGQKWVLSSQAQVVMPQPAESVEQLQQQQQQRSQGPQQNKQLIAQAEVQWGGAQKQNVQIRVQGTQAHTQQVRRILQQQKEQGQQLISAESQRAFARRSSFLNKFKVHAKGILQAGAKHVLNSALEHLKNQYFWNAQSQLTGQETQRNGMGQMSALITIDPITGQHANVTIKTPTQQVRLQQIQLPRRVAPFPLIRQHSAQQTHSLSQAFSRFSVQQRAQCTADGQTVQTFDGSEYPAPLSGNCYSVLAKDCGSEQPQFAVLMKKQQQPGKNAKNAQKKLKVITPEQEIECQPKHNSAQLQCKLNGQQVQDEQDQQDQEEQQTVQFNNARKSDVTIHVEGIAVRFNGRKAWLKVSPAYKNTQCGLCGHYDDSAQQEDEWRMADGSVAPSSSQFHRSYALQDEEQCTQQELDQFYSQNGNNNGDGAQQQRDNYFQQLQRQQQFDDSQEDDSAQQGQNKQRQQQDSSEESSEAEDRSWGGWQKEQFNGQIDEDQYQNRRRQQFFNSQEDEELDMDQDPFNNNAENDLFDQQQQKTCCCCCPDGDSTCLAKCNPSKQCDNQCKNNQCSNGKKTKKYYTPGDLFLNKQQQPQCCCCCETTCQKQCTTDECKKNCKSQCRDQCKQDSQGECKQKCKAPEQQCGGQYQQGQQYEQVSPVWKTKVQEQNHAVCFSTQPVKQCPRFARSATRSAVAFDSSSQQQDDASAEDQQDEEEETKNVSFACFDRADPQARRLLRQLRAGQRVVQVAEEHGASFTEQVREPVRCVRRRS